METAGDSRSARGSREAYERYLQAMDASMRHKVALTAAHILCAGTVADMGMGSGAGSEALAALYPMLEVVGVDLDPTMVELARGKYVRKNLRFVQGDIAAHVFPAESLDGVFDSSVLHHVTSFGGYEHARAARCLEVQARALKPHGVLVVRDFLAPPEGDVLLELPVDDGDSTHDPRTASSAALFERFAREFRSLHPQPGFVVREEPSPRPGFRRFRLPRRLAVEFVLRKDYRADWESEVQEEYTYFSQEEFEALYSRLGLRVLASTPLRNPWIVRNRFVGKFALLGLDGEPEEWPATNYVIAGERVAVGEGVRFRERRESTGPGFLTMDHYRDRRDGRVRDLVRRPNATLDVVPYFEEDGDVFVVARRSYPRPILASDARTPSLDGSSPPHYVTEPLVVLQADKPLGQTVEEMLEAHARVPAERVRGFHLAGTYYPSPGGSQEEVRGVLVEIDPLFVEPNVGHVSGLSTSGRVRAVEAEQLLRAAQVGGLPDARLELAVYALFVKLGRAPGPWLGEELRLVNEAAGIVASTVEGVMSRPQRRAFSRVGREASPGFLELCASVFEELSGSGDVVGSVRLEYVVPRGLGTNTVACALLARKAGETCLGVDDDDLPAAQCFRGSSEILVAPAWRLPRDITGARRSQAWVRARLAEEYGLELGEIWDLGGAYTPSAGMSPELTSPMAVEVLAERDAPRRLTWLPLAELCRRGDALLDGHLRVVAHRAAHALGLFAPLAR